MIQLNLLPDVKLQYIKARRDKRTIILIASFVILVSVGLTGMMLSFVYVAQRGHIKNLDQDTNKGIATIQNTEGINEILTIQNQLGVVNTKHEEKPATTRVLPFVAQMLPEGAKITSIDIDFVGFTLSISGTTTDINSTNKLVDTLKFAEYTTKSGLKGMPFNSVVLSNYSTKDGQTSYSVSMLFDTTIFKNTEEVALSVPGIVSTRSDTEKPKINFDKKAEPSPEQTGEQQ